MFELIYTFGLSRDTHSAILSQGYVSVELRMSTTIGSAKGIMNYRHLRFYDRIGLNSIVLTFEWHS